MPQEKYFIIISLMTNLFKLLTNVINKGKVVKIIRKILHPDGIHCPNCNSKQVRLKSKKHKFPRQYQCKCDKCFSEVKGTILEYCKLDIVTVFLLMILLSLKLSSRRISKLLCIEYNSIYRLVITIMKNLFCKRLEYEFSGENEIDEVYITAGKKGEIVLDREARVRGLSRRGRGTYDTDRPPILGIVNRGTKLIHLSVCKNVQMDVIKPIIQRVIDTCSSIYTDEYCIYSRLFEWGYTHKTVCHSRYEFALDYDGDGINEVHCNTMEGIWSLLRQYMRQFRGINKKNLKYYVIFFEYSHNAEILNFSSERIIRDMLTKNVA
jgi:transposase-like protein